MTGAPAEIGVGVIGLGFIGGGHVRAYQAAREAGHPCRLVAVCDVDPQRRSGRAAVAGNIDTGDATRPLFDLAQVRAYADAAELIADPDVQLVSICTHTDTHVELARRALRAGKHVLVEKPVATRAVEVRRLARVAAGARTLCMPAMCMRFWPGWTWLKQRIEERTFGNVESAVFVRLGSPPDWSPEFYLRPERSGGAVVDLHIHDVDFIRWCFGQPEAVVSTGSRQHVTTLYRYAAGPRHVVAEGGWFSAAGFQFRMRYLVGFERAVVEYDSTREPRLTVMRDGRSEAVPLEATTGVDGEIRHLLEAISSGSGNLRATIADSELTLRVLEAELRSLETGKPARPR